MLFGVGYWQLDCPWKYFYMYCSGSFVISQDMSGEYQAGNCCKWAMVCEAACWCCCWVLMMTLLLCVDDAAAVCCSGCKESYPAEADYNACALGCRSQTPFAARRHQVWWVSWYITQWAWWSPHAWSEGLINISVLITHLNSHTCCKEVGYDCTVLYIDHL